MGKLKIGFLSIVDKGKAICLVISFILGNFLIQLSSPSYLLYEYTYTFPKKEATIMNSNSRVIGGLFICTSIDMGQTW